MGIRLADFSLPPQLLLPLRHVRGEVRGEPIQDDLAGGLAGVPGHGLALNPGRELPAARQGAAAAERTINEHIARAEAIPEDVRAMIKGTSLDTGTYLDSIEGMEPDDQRAPVKRDLAEPKRRARNLVATHARIIGLHQLSA